MTGLPGGVRNGPGIVATDTIDDLHFQRVRLDVGGPLAPVPVVGALPVTTADTGAIDAFGRWRVSEPVTLFDSKVITADQPLIWSDIEASGAGTTSAHDAGTASVTMAVSAVTAGVRVRQTKRAIPYQPGKSQLVFQTYTLGAAAAGITRRVGLFTAASGIILEQTAAGLAWVVRSSTSGAPVDTAAAQADWNLDAMDGTGPSGFTLDPEQSQISIIDFEWLGVGRVRVGFVLDGIPVYVHQFNHANRTAGVYMSTPNLPVRYEIANDGTGGAADLHAICSSVMSEGGRQQTGLRRTVDRGATGLVTLNNANIYPLIAIRLNSGYLDATATVDGLRVVCSSTALYRWSLVLNPTVAGTALSFTQVANSAVDAAAGATNATTVSGGTLLASGYGSDTQSATTPLEAAFSDIGLGSSAAGVADVIVLAAERISGTTETFFASLTWVEAH